MKFIKNYNNNAALVEDQNHTEWIVLGKGIGFGMKAGMDIDDTKIAKRFIAEDSKDLEPENFKDLSQKAMEAAGDVAEMSKEKFGITFNGYQYFALADHIDFSIKRTLDGIEFADGTVKWEVKKLFPKEFAVALEALKIIKEDTGIVMGESEAIYLTYHFINAESDGTKLKDTVKISKYINGIINIVQYQYGIELDPESFNYNRFIGHLRALMVQHISHSTKNDNLDPSLLQLMQVKYKRASETVERINQYLKQNADWELNDDDRVYMALHICRVTHRQKES